MRENLKGAICIIAGLGLGVGQYFSLIPAQIAFLGPPLFIIGNLYLLGHIIDNIKDDSPKWNAKLEVQKLLEKKNE